MIAKRTFRKYAELTTWGGEFKGTETDIIKSFIIKHHAFICIFNKLMDRESRIIRLNNRIRDLRRREYRESKHHSIRVFLSDS